MITRFFGDKRATSAIEFAFLAPVFIISLFGLADAGNALMAQRAAVQAAFSAAQTAASYSKASAGVPELSGGALLLVARGVRLTLPSRDNSTISMQITQIRRAGGMVSTGWSVGQGGPGAPKIDQAAYSAHMKDGESLILAEVRVTRAFMFGMLNNASYTLSANYSVAPDI